jgi:hypothetical protein
VAVVVARSSVIGAELTLNVTVFDVLGRQADFDYVSDNGNLPLPAMGNLP